MQAGSATIRKHLLALGVTAFVWSLTLVFLPASEVLAQASNPEAVPVAVDLSGIVLEEGGAACTSQLLVSLTQQQPGGRTLYRHCRPPIDPQGGFMHHISAITLMPGIPVAIVVAPLEAGLSGLDPSLAKSTGREARRCAVQVSLTSTHEPNHFTLDLGKVILLEAPLVGRVKVVGPAKAQVSMFARPKASEGAVASVYEDQLRINTSAKLQPGTEVSLYSWEADTSWLLTGKTADGYVIPPAELVSGRTVTVQLVKLLQLHVLVPATYVDSRALLLFHAATYAPPVFDFPGPKTLHVDSRIRKAHSDAARAGMIATFSDVLPGCYVLELWTANDYETGVPSSTAFLCLTESTSMTL